MSRVMRGVAMSHSRSSKGSKDGSGTRFISFFFFPSSITLTAISCTPCLLFVHPTISSPSPLHPLLTLLLYLQFYFLSSTKQDNRTNRSSVTLHQFPLPLSFYLSFHFTKRNENMGKGFGLQCAIITSCICLQRVSMYFYYVSIRKINYKKTNPVWHYEWVSCENVVRGKDKERGECIRKREEEGEKGQTVCGGCHFLKKRRYLFPSLFFLLYFHLHTWSVTHKQCRPFALSLLVVLYFFIYY